MKKTLYQFLDVEPTASLDDISTAWQKSYEQHEDFEKTDDPKAANHLLLLNDARLILLDVNKRAQYDQKLSQPKILPLNKKTKQDTKVKQPKTPPTKKNKTRYES